MADKAIGYWLKAGQRSQEKSENVEAIAQFENGLKLVMSGPAGPERDMLELGFKLPLGAALMAVQGYGAPQVEPVQNRCIEICRKLGKGSPLFPILIANWEWLFIRGRFESCATRCPEVIAIAEADLGPGMSPKRTGRRSALPFMPATLQRPGSTPRSAGNTIIAKPASNTPRSRNRTAGRCCWCIWACRCGNWAMPNRHFARSGSPDMARDLKHTFTPR